MIGEKPIVVYLLSMFLQVLFAFVTACVKRELTKLIAYSTSLNVQGNLHLEFSLIESHIISMVLGWLRREITDHYHFLQSIMILSIIISL